MTGIGEFIDARMSPPQVKKNLPVITNIHPDEAAPGMEIYIFGENLNYFQMAYYGNTVMECKGRSSTEIECYIPDNITGDGTIKVVTADGEAVYKKQFGAHIDPEIVRIKPDSAHEGISDTYIGDKITIEGKNFINTPEVTFGANRAASVQAVSRTERSVTVPHMAAGTYALKIKTTAGEVTRSNFVVKARPVPSLSSFPSSVLAGNTFKIHGNNFTYGTKIIFISGGREVATHGITSISNQEAQVEAPEQIGTYTLRMRTAYGEATSNSTISVVSNVPTDRKST